MKKDDKKVTIFVISNDKEIADDNFDQENYESDEMDECCSPRPVKKTIKKTVEPKIAISKKFKIKKGSPITDLKSLIEAFNHSKSTKMQKEFREILIELDNMIGMTSFKEQIINQILFFLQDFQEKGMFLHTVLTGSPGSGKTSVCNILAKIYSKLGVLESDKVVRADRSSLIGKYLGSTSIKTKAVLESAKGGILLLDEVYSLGNKDGGDSFSKECIDTINQYLSEHVDDLICIVAGYKEQVNECFFNHNPGLERRFPWKFNIDEYKSEELVKIMKMQLTNSEWSFDDIDDAYLLDIIKNNKEHFMGNGGSTRNFIDKCKIYHARRVFTDSGTITLSKRRKKEDGISPNFGPTKINKSINKEDIQGGIKYLKEGEKKNNNVTYMNSMYI